MRKLIELSLPRGPTRPETLGWLIRSERGSGDEAKPPAEAGHWDRWLASRRPLRSHGHAGLAFGSGAVRATSVKRNASEGKPV